MAINILGDTTGTIAEVETNPLTLRSVLAPGNLIGSYTCSFQTTVSNTASNVNNVNNLAFTNTSERLCVLRRITISAGISNIATTVGTLSFVVIPMYDVALYNTTSAIKQSVVKLRTEFPESIANIGASFNGFGGSSVTLPTGNIVTSSFGEFVCSLQRSDNGMVNTGSASNWTLFDSLSSYPWVIDNGDGFVVRHNSTIVSTSVSSGLAINLFWDEYRGY